MVNKLNAVYNTLSLIGTKGQETLQMAACLNTVQQISQGLATEELAKEQRKEHTVAVVNTLSLIETKGQSTLYMAGCLNTLQQVIRELNAPETEDVEEPEEDEEPEPVPHPKKKKK